MNEEEDEAFFVARDRGRMLRKVGSMLNAFGTYYGETYLNKKARREPDLMGYENT